MTTSATEAVTGPYYPNGLTTQFPFDFKAVAADEVSVIRVASDGTIAILPDADFAVVIAADGEGGTVTMATAPANDGRPLFVISEPSFEQQILFEDEGPFNSAVLNPLADRGAVRDIWLRGQVQRSMRVPFGEDGPVLPTKGTRAGRFAAFDAGGDFYPASGTGADAALRVDLAANGGPLVAVKTPAAPGIVTKLGDALPDINLGRFFGIRSDNTGDDTAALDLASQAIQAAGGGVLRLAPGGRTRLAGGGILRPGVKLDGQGGTLFCPLAGGNASGIRMRSLSRVENCWIDVDSSGEPGSQGGIHAPIAIGAFYGENPSIAAISPDEGVYGCVVRNVLLSTNKYLNPGGGNIGATAIQIVGDVHHCLIEQVAVGGRNAGTGKFELVNSRMVGAINMDWGFVGNITSAEASMAANKAAFQAGTAYTTHPHDIVVRGVRVGSLTSPVTGVDTGSTAVRLSGCHAIHVSDVYVDLVTYNAFVHTAGDLGYEFARTRDKLQRLKGNVIENCQVVNGGTATLAYLDSLADNVARAVTNLGYAPMIETLHETDVTLRNVVGMGDGGAAANYGIRCTQLRGGLIENCEAAYYKRGLYIDDMTYDTVIRGSRFHHNREHGGSMEHGVNPPRRVRIENSHFYANGTDAGAGNSAGLFVGKSIDCIVKGNKVGTIDQADATQFFGIRAADAVVGLEVEGNYVFSTKVGGIGYSLFSGGDFNHLALFARNRVNQTYVATPYGGVEVLPIDYRVVSNGKRVTDYEVQRGISYAGIATEVGDTFRYRDPQSTGSMGFVTTVAGTIGTAPAKTAPMPALGAEA